MSKRVLSSFVVEPFKGEIAQKVYKPDFSTEEKLFNLTGMNNVIDIMMQKPNLAQQIQANLQVIQLNCPDTSELSDSQIVGTCVDRQYDVNEVSEFIERDLNDFKNK